MRPSAHRVQQPLYHESLSDAIRLPANDKKKSSEEAHGTLQRSA